MKFRIEKLNAGDSNEIANHLVDYFHQEKDGI